MAAVTVASTTEAPVRRGVPWLTVLPLAVVMAYADGFWVLSLRGAVGAIERSTSPFISWLRESTLSLPLYVLAVLAALTLARRLLGPNRRTWRAVVATILLVAAAGTLVGIAQEVASSAYDYFLQTSQIEFMNAVHPMCTTNDCVTTQEGASLGLQLRSVLYGVQLLLVTNLVLVAWVVAMRGGRLDLVRAGSSAQPGLEVDGTADSGNAVEGKRAADLVLLLIGLLVGSAIIHAAAVPAYLAEWPLGGLLFAVIAASALVVAAFLLLMPRPAVYIAAIVVSQAPLALWLVSHTSIVSTSAGPGLPVPVALVDIAAMVLEITTLVVALVLLHDGRWLHQPGRATESARWMAALAVVAVTAIGIGGSGLPGFEDYAAHSQLPVPVSTHGHTSGT